MSRPTQKGARPGRLEPSRPRIGLTPGFDPLREPTSHPGSRTSRLLLIEPRRPAFVRSWPQAHWLAVAAVCVGAFMGQLDASIVSLAFPTLRQDFHTTLGAVQWVGLTYLLVVISIVPIVGRVSDMIGRKLVYTYGFIVFAVGSALCAASPDLLTLDACRALQGLGAAMLQANSIAIISLSAPRQLLGRSLGIQGAAQAIGLSLGPTAGGALLAIGGWRLIFLINVPFGAVGAAAACLLLPRSRDLKPREPLDWREIAFFTPALVSILIVLSYGDTLGWTSPFILGCVFGSALLACGFIRANRRSKAPLFDPRLFSNRTFAAGISSGALAYVVLFGVLFATPFLLESVQRLTPGETGALLSALPLSLGASALFAGSHSKAVGSRALTAIGMSATAFALTLLGLLHQSWAEVGIWLGVAGIGLGMFMPSNTAVLMTLAPRRQAALVGGMLNMTRGVGTSFGLAATGLVFATVAGSRARPMLVDRAFETTALFLALIATSSALIAALRPSPLAHR